jgi:hypothetical protein
MTLAKQAAEKTKPIGTRVLHDQWYPSKINNINRAAVVDAEGKVLPGPVEMVAKENETQVAKLSWLSYKDSGKAYG